MKGNCFFVLLGIVFILSSCASVQQPQIFSDTALQMRPADLPSHIPGEYYTFDNSKTMAVAGVDGNTVIWDYGGQTSRGYLDFLIPHAAWEDSKRISETTTSVTKSTLWPLETGKTTKFESEQLLLEKDQPAPRSVKRYWSCVVEGTEKVKVPAGEFDTYRLTCKRYSGEDNGWRGTTSYYYSPLLGQYVMAKRQYPGRPSKVEKLTSYGYNSTFLPTKDQKTLKKTLQTTLSKNRNGFASSWTSSSKNVSVMLIPAKPVIDSGKRTCREYRSVYNVGGRIYQHTRELCHSGDKQWQRAK